MKIVLAFDKFKGNMTSAELGELAKQAISSVINDAEVIVVPVADGGEGSIDAIFHARGGKVVQCEVNDAIHKNVMAEYLLLSDKIAVIETSKSCGLSLLPKKEPLLSSTYGVGELVLDAVKNGAKSVYLTIGGSATTDGGMGMLSALGVIFFDKNNNILKPCGINLIKIDHIDNTNIDKRVKDVKFFILTDVKNVLCGTDGAAFMYSPQKGATISDVVFLEKGMMNLAQKVSETVFKDFSECIGAGAGGGLAFGAFSFLKANQINGAIALLDIINFESILNGADYVLTGEGRFDCQSLMGKVVCGIAAKVNKSVPIIVFAGDISDVSEKQMKEYGIKEAFSTNIMKLPFESAIKRAKSDFYDTIVKWVQSIKS